jgi:hypothetical protein
MPGLTAQQICSLARQTAKVPGWTTQSGQLLNMILADLCQTYDFDLCMTTAAFNFTGQPGPYSLPSDFLRFRKGQGVFTIDGVPYNMIPMDIQQYDLLVLTAGMNSYPTMYAVDMATSPPSAYFWPPPSGAYPFTGRYQRQMPEITTPESSSTVPWFPNQDYLLRRLSGELMNIADDNRAADYLGDDPKGFGAQALLREYLKMKDNPEGRVNTVQLDRQLFGSKFMSLPNTKRIGW